MDKFKLYSPKDYCENSNTYLFIKSAVIIAWEDVSKKNSSQLHRVRYNAITPMSTIEELTTYSCGNNSTKRNYFIERFKRAIRMAFPDFRFRWDSYTASEGFNLTNKTSLTQLYNVLKTYKINKYLKVEDERKLHENYKREYI